MSVQSIIVETSEEKIKALASRAEKAVEKPDHGVKIITQGAFFVIRDCAQMAKDYLPMKLYGHFEDPIKSLKGKFTKKDIVEFVSQKDMASKQLCQLMIIDAVKVASLGNKTAVIKNVDDVYGDYGSDILQEEEQEFDYNNKNHVIELLTKAFVK